MQGDKPVPELPQGLWSPGSLQQTFFPLKWPEAELPYRNLGLEKPCESGLEFKLFSFEEGSISSEGEDI